MKLSEKIKRSISGKERVEEGMYELERVKSSIKIEAGQSYLSAGEISVLKDILNNSSISSSDVAEDFSTLANITGEIKSINHQSVLLHGERICSAKKLFKSYGELAFSKWLRTVYGNRQTPYNFLKYYSFYVSLTSELQEKMLTMPKQIIYTIASRSCSDEQKQSVIESYDGESKDTYIKAIRKAFPLERKDRRAKIKETNGRQIIYLLEAAKEGLDTYKSKFSYEDLRNIDTLLKSLTESLWQE